MIILPKFHSLTKKSKLDNLIKYDCMVGDLVELGDLLLQK